LRTSNNSGDGDGDGDGDGVGVGVGVGRSGGVQISEATTDSHVWNAANPTRVKPKFQSQLSGKRFSRSTLYQRLIMIAQQFILVWCAQLLMIVLLPGIHIYTGWALIIVTLTVSGFNVFALPALILIGSSLAQHYQHSRSHRSHRTTYL
jgi:hypothetical protein